jgi:phosphoenolpyruvate carboxykinase (GTP)
MADYWAHWLSFASRMDEDKLPKVFTVNWFRKGADGRFLWPGFGENSRVLEWVFDRCAGRGEITETPIGLLPLHGVIDISGTDVSEADMDELLDVDSAQWTEEAELVRQYYATFGDKMPAELVAELDALEARLRA